MGKGQGKKGGTQRPPNVKEDLLGLHNLVGQCMICCKKNIALSKEHAPPQSYGNQGDLEIHSEIEYWVGAKKMTPYRSKNGLYFRSVCAESCNNRVGLNYDKELQKVGEAVRAHVEKHGWTGFASVRMKPMRVMKSICAHLLAVKTGVDGSTPDEKMRAFVASDVAPLPEGMHFHCFPRPSDSIVIYRDEGTSLVVDGQRVADVIQIMLSAPISFILSGLSKFPGAQLFSLPQELGPDDEIDFAFDLSLIHKEERWPVDRGVDTVRLVGAQGFKNVHGKRPLGFGPKPSALLAGILKRI